MGIVYKARDTRLGRFAALKFLAPRIAESLQARYRSLEEARAIATLNHSNIATIYEIRETQGGPVLVLEYLPNGTLRSRIGSPALSVAEILRFGIEAAEGLAHAHNRGLIHRDIKPENLMLSDEGRIKVTDFGLARSFGEGTITMQGISGTPGYMAPECLRGAAADRQSDIFSLGVVLEELSAGRSMPAVFRDLLARTTARDRGQRFQTMQDLASALRRVEQEPDARSGEPPTILVIEDDDGLRSVLEMGLANEGYQVLKAATGHEGLRLAVEKAPLVVLLDVMMPGPNGFDVCRELRRNGFRGFIIMVTGRTDEVDRVVGLEIGADDYLTKPFGQRELVARIRAHLRRTDGHPDRILTIS
jgi:CheY-like chemotaxis protein